MYKKLIGIVGALIMLFGIFGLAGCAESLDKYKDAKIIELQTYADSKGESNYTVENWETIGIATENGKMSIEASNNRSLVDDAVTLAKGEIDMVSRKLRGGYDDEGVEPAPPIWTEFTSDESRLKVGDNLVIKFYYAPQSSYDISTYDPAPISVTAKIITGYGTYTRKLLQKGDYTYSQPEYTFEYENKEEFVKKEISNFANSNNYPTAGSEFVAFEEIEIPANWFVGEMGAIGWTVVAKLTWAEEAGIDSINQSGGVSMYYRIEGENIILYSSYYNFSNDIR
ncbi:MAG: hypothetical protein ACOX4W_03130 [Bacilli bacterium]|jgi:hypothetical protein